jgi:hypothetical protein
MATEPETQYLIVAEVNADTVPQVGAVARPPRPITAGRRRSDRMVAYALAVFLVFASLFVVLEAFRTQQLVDLLNERTTVVCPK